MKLLSGVKVVSFNHFLSGPVAAQILADLGADVIAVEPPEGAFHRNWAVGNQFVGGQSVNLLTSGRNKRSLALDLKSEDGRRVALRLIAGSDVVMENFRPGTMERLGLGATALRAELPRLIYAAATGYGPSGPYRDRPGQDLLIQALSGLAAHTGRADGPPTAVGAVIIDHHAAVLYALGIVAALFERERTGQGRLVEVNLFQAAVDLQGESITAWLNGAGDGSPRGPAGIASWFSPGPYGVHATGDGHVALSLSPLAALAEALERPELASFGADESFSRREEITRIVAEALPARTTEAWAPRFEAAKVWWAPVASYDDLRDDPQLAHMNAFETIKGAGGVRVTLLKHPVHYDGATPPVRFPPQPLGAQTRDVLAEAGFSPSEIADLEASGVVLAAEAEPLV